MANLARDEVLQYFPDQLIVKLGGVTVAEGAELTLPVGTRGIELSATIISKGSVHGSPGDSGPFKLSWVFNGGAHANFTSPSSPSTRLATLDPDDVGQITLTAVGRFDILVRSFGITVPGTP
jgi:hypothetical protein